MNKLQSILPRGLAASIMMIAIFLFSSQPSESLPDFLNWDYLIKKSSHVIGYGLLGFSCLHYFTGHPKKYRISWLTTVLYAVTDEFHQSFVPGRSASILDVLLFDNLGAIIALWISSIIEAKRAKPPE